MNPITVAIRGVQINSALYLAGVFVGGLVTGNAWAWKLAVIATGVTYLSYLAQVPGVRERFPCDPTPEAIWLLTLRGRNCVVLVSIVLGALAGIALLF